LTIRTFVAIGSVNHVEEAAAAEDVVALQHANTRVLIVIVRIPTNHASVVDESVIVVGGDNAVLDEALL
jgi:hypothetical protein